MLLLINNKRSLKEYTPSINTKLSSVPKLKRALRHLHLKFHEVKGIDEQLLNPSSQLHRQITGVIISGSSMKLSRDLNISQYVHILRYLQAFSHVPVLGICFGAQLLVCLYGGTVIDQGKYICEKLPVRILPRIRECCHFCKYPANVLFLGLTGNSWWSQTHNSYRLDET